MLEPEHMELAAVWYPGKDSSPGWLEPGEVSGHSKVKCVQTGLLLFDFLLGMSWVRKGVAVST